MTPTTSNSWKEFVSRVSFMPEWYINIVEDSFGERLYLRFKTQDSRDPAKTTLIHSSYSLPPFDHVQDNEMAISIILSHVMDLLHHEAREWLTLDGVRLFDPHDVLTPGPKDFRKHFVGISDNVTFVATQLDGVDVSVYRTRIIIKPENIIPNLDLVTGDRDPK